MLLQEADEVLATDEEGCQWFAGSPRGTEDDEEVGGATGPVLWATEVGEL